ncbi:MAG TPA: glycine oxidase ThiO [Chloroflexota bacterium]|nr:glycine oxidase ThiO [Chloroflexota bacterium]
MPEALVVGGGIIGLLIARELRSAGRSVALLDRDRPGREASWASAGIVGARAPWAHSATGRLQTLSAELWPRLAQELRDETGMDVEYRQTGALHPALSDDQAERMRFETAAARRAGLAFEFVEGTALREAEPALGPAVVAAQLGPGGNVENRRAVRALELACRRAGVEIRSGAPVLEVTSRDGKASGVRTLDGEEQGADVVVLAAGSWSGQVRGVDPPVPVVPQRGQILALRSGDVFLRRTVLKEADPYLVPRADGRIVVGATREFVGYDRRLTAGGIAWLLGSAIELVPAFAGAEIVEMWTGFRPVSADGLPIVGASAIEGLYYATGHGPSGVGPAPGTAALLAALVLGREPPIPPEAFSPLRFGALQAQRRG